MYPKNKRTGFTLIELLIVVAIIAILAAIAVPNFLEAQTRSKVSRAKADLRNLATAVETYKLDNNVYPYSTTRGIGLPWSTTRAQEMKMMDDAYNNWQAGTGAPPTYYGVFPEEMTTPVAYLTSLPNDVFKDAGFGVTHDTDIPLPKDHPWHRYGYSTRRHFATIFDDSWLATEQPHPEWLNKEWLAVCIGPDRTEDVYSPWTLAEYDPTNGTVSKGDISRSGP